MTKEFKFTHEECDRRFLEALNQEEAPEKGAVKPNALQMLLNKAKLRGKGERESTEPTI